MRILTASRVGIGLLLLASSGAALEGCKRGSPARGNVVPPALAAGFSERTGPGWRLAAPIGWQQAADAPDGTWLAADTQPVNDYRANVSVLVEPFAGPSKEYARASVALVRAQPQAVVESVREDVLDGDPTLVVESRWVQKAPPVELRAMQAHLASRGSGYVVTCSVSSGAFERYRSTCQTIIESFAVGR